MPICNHCELEINIHNFNRHEQRCPKQLLIKKFRDDKMKIQHEQQLQRYELLKCTYRCPFCSRTLDSMELKRNHPTLCQVMYEERCREQAREILRVKPDILCKTCQAEFFRKDLKKHTKICSVFLGISIINYSKNVDPEDDDDITSETEMSCSECYWIGSHKDFPFHSLIEEHIGATSSRTGNEDYGDENDWIPFLPQLPETYPFKKKYLDDFIDELFVENLFKI